jgi:hypothetical protein
VIDDITVSERLRGPQTSSGGAPHNAKKEFDVTFSSPSTAGDMRTMTCNPFGCNEDGCQPRFTGLLKSVGRISLNTNILDIWDEYIAFTIVGTNGINGRDDTITLSNTDKFKNRVAPGDKLLITGTTLHDGKTYTINDVSTDGRTVTIDEDIAVAETYQGSDSVHMDISRAFGAGAHAFDVSVSATGFPSSGLVESTVATGSTLMITQIVISGNVGTCTHADMGSILVSTGDEVTFAGSSESALNTLLTVTGTPTLTGFTVDVSGKGIGDQTLSEEIAVTYGVNQIMFSQTTQQKRDGLHELRTTMTSDLFADVMVGDTITMTSATDMAHNSHKNVQYEVVGVDVEVHIVPPLEVASSKLTSSFAVVREAGSCNVTEVIRGTKENAECGNRGLCDRTSGLCNCFPGFAGISCETQEVLD